MSCSVELVQLHLHLHFLLQRPCRRVVRIPVEGMGEYSFAATLTFSGDDALQSKTNEVTDALRRTTALMQSELERSVLSVQILGEWLSTSLTDDR
jgi:hypothetical protein